jgi:GNAT superfamily N-acetyltransferase
MAITDSIEIRTTLAADFNELNRYFAELSYETKRRFAPHPEDADTLKAICEHSYQSDIIPTIAIDTSSSRIVAYTLVKLGLNWFDNDRLKSYGIELSPRSCATLAPSVADSYQGKGIGWLILRWVVEELQKQNRTTIVLWGGVQADNKKAISYYLRNGFKEVGRFEHDGQNIDMIYHHQC